MAAQVLVDLFSDYCRAKEKEAAEAAASSAVDPKPDDGGATTAAAAESEPPAKATRYSRIQIQAHSFTVTQYRCSKTFFFA